jgi:hypothetical protein
MRLLPILFAPALIAQAPMTTVETPLSGAERAQAGKVLGEAKAALLNALAGLSPAQRAWQPAPDRWSIDQCAEHIVVTEELLSEQIVSKLLAGPREPQKRAEIRFLDAELLSRLQDRGHKAQAPEILKPTHRFATPADLEAAFSAAHGKLEEAARTSQADWRGRVYSHPLLGTLDAYQWLILAAGHTLRHVQQIEEVKRTAGFPSH